MVNQLVILVNFEDKRVVYAVLAEYLDGYSCRKHNPSHDEQEYERVFTKEERIPANRVLHLIMWGQNVEHYHAEEHEDAAE